MRFIGLDAGSVSVKAVVLDEKGERLYSAYKAHAGHPLLAASAMLREAAGGKADDCSLAVTGSAGRLLSSIFGIQPINEIVAQAYYVRRLHPGVKSIIEIGGEDSKLILLDEGVKDFSMNSVCAAGTGSFLDQQAERLRLTIEEFSALALKSPKPPRIAGRCSVFAKSDMIHLQQIATPVEDIVAGLCFAVARNFKGSIARGRQVLEPVCFQGGVAANKGMIRAFKEVFELKDLFVPEDFALTGAWGAALKARDEGAFYGFDPRAIEEFLAMSRQEAGGHKPLIDPKDDFHKRHFIGEAASTKPEEKTDIYMGIDIGSISTNLALIDETGRLIAKRYLMTAGRPIEAVMQGLREVEAEVGNMVNIIGVGTTGSGRYMIADYVGADIVKNEITAQATAAAFIDKNVDTIFEIGGQDSKYISLRDGVIADFEMNKACAAGTGSFLEEQAEKLGISVKEEFARQAFSSSGPLRLGERCTVFMENSLMANLQKGAGKDDLLSGLAYSIVQNYINRVVAGKPIGKNIFFQGGVAFNKAVVAAFEKYLGVKVTVPPHHDVTGAIGMALIAKDYMKGKNDSAFKGFSIVNKSYSVSSFECRGCPNVCEINRVKIDGETGNLLYGGRCEKYDARRKKPDEGTDLFALRERLIRGSEDELAPSACAKNKKAVLGIPYVFSFHDQMPFWTTYLRELGFAVKISPKTNRAIISRGLESVLSEACYPVKVAHGHIAFLSDGGVDAVFMPSFVNSNRQGEEYQKGASCPHTQTIPYVTKVALEGLKAVTPIVDFSRGRQYMASEMKRALKDWGITKREALRAYDAALCAQEDFGRAISAKGEETLKSLSPGEKAVVIVGRAYNSFDRGMNLEIPEKLSALGVRSVPMDFLPSGDIGILQDWPNMYWRSGQKILRAARYISSHPNLFPIFLGNFSCGPDSFILKYFKQELKGKPFLHIEIDEHSADAGAITRCEAFLDSIDGARRKAEQSAPGSKPVKPLGRRVVYIPRMSDHAFALKAAFERSGVSAQVLPEPDKETTELGMKYVSGKECYPCAVTTGDMLKRAFSTDFRPGESAFFMPSGTGPCRFGQYNVFHKQVLESAGFGEVPIFAPNQDAEFYRDLGMVGSGFFGDSWRGIVAIELLYKCLHETRPYEKENGVSDALYKEYLDMLYTALKGNGKGVEEVLSGAKRAFAAVPRHDGRKPLIGIVGEIFVRSNKFSNEDLVRKIEALGGEAWLSPVEEWVHYVTHIAKKRALLKKSPSDIINVLVKEFFQKRIEHSYSGLMGGFLKTSEEPTTSGILKKARPYVHDSFEGETVLSIGKAVDLAERGASGIVNAMPFGCMPGTIVTALIRAITRRYGIPAISIPYDGTESSTVIIQLEAFMDQAKTGFAKKLG